MAIAGGHNCVENGDDSCGLVWRLQRLSGGPGSSVGTASEVAAEDPFAVALEGEMPALLASDKVPGAVVSCIKNGEISWTKAFGLADVRTRSLMRPER